MSAERRLELVNVAQLMNVLRHDSSRKRIVLANMSFGKTIKNFAMLSDAQSLSFVNSTIKNYSILKFDQWCPNITELSFLGVEFSRRAFDFLVEPYYPTPAIKSFTFDFKDTMEMFSNFLGEIDEKFPELESLTLVFTGTDPEGYFMWDDQSPYQPMFFEDLKKLSLAAFGDGADRIFDYMSICNTCLEELEFIGFWLTEENGKWIKRCPELIKLTIGLPGLEGYHLKYLKNMKKLQELHLNVGSIECGPMKMVEFFRKNKELKMISIECKRNNKELTFDDVFKKEFEKLAQEREQVTIKATFGIGCEQALRHMKITKEGFEETMPLIDEDDSDTEDDTWSWDDTWSSDDTSSSDDTWSSDDSDGQE